MKRNLMDGVMDATLKMMKGYEAFLDKEFKKYLLTDSSLRVEPS